MKVVSLFDGMGCLRIALQELGINIEKYYASEIDKFAIKQTQLNFPDTIHLGSVTDWQSWDIDWSKIDLIGGGSPCQGFSFAGKQLAFDDPRSKLFFVFVEILNHCRKFNPKVRFLLENVDMKKDHLRIISEYVGIFPTNINSALVSAQNRSRWYWTNIKTKQIGLFDELYADILQPEDRGILLRDILQPENEIDKKYYLSTKAINCIQSQIKKRHNDNFQIEANIEFKSRTLRKDISKNGTDDNYIKCDRNGTPKADQSKASSLTIGGHGCGNHSDMDMICVAMRGRGEDNLQQLEPQTLGKTNTLTSVSKDNLIMTKNYLQWDVSGKGYKSQQDRAFYEDTKHGTLSSSRSENKTGFFFENGTLRRLTPIECSRLQTIPNWYKWECSDSSIYRMLGNGWTIEVIKHILSFYSLNKL